MSLENQLQLNGPSRFVFFDWNFETRIF